MKKPCVKCNKQIPASALNCVFCSTRQPPPPLDEILAGLDRLPKGDDDDFSDDLAASYATEPTLVGFSMQALAEASAKRDLELGRTPPASTLAFSAPGKSVAKPEPTTPAVAVATTEPERPKEAPAVPPPPQRAPESAPRAARRPSAAEQRARNLLRLGGGAVLLLLLLPAGTVSFWDRLQVLCGSSYLAFFGCLASSLFFVLVSILPLDRFRQFGLAALVGILVVAVNGWGVAGAWQSILGSVAVGVLATQLLEGAPNIMATRVAAGVAVLLIFIPGPHGVPLMAAVHMLSGGNHARALLGLLLLLPPLLGALALIPEPPLGRRLLAALVVAWAPAALLTAGLLVGDELQVRLAFGVLCASVLTVVALAEVLRPGRHALVARG